MSLKRYYSLDEAVEFIRTIVGSPFQVQDVFDLARRNELRLCVYVSARRVTLCDCLGEQGRVGPNGILFAMDILHAYIDIPPDQFSRNTSFPILIEQVWRIREDLSPWKTNSENSIFGKTAEHTAESFRAELGRLFLWTFCKEVSIPELVESATTGKFEIEALAVQQSDIVVPAEDLLALRRVKEKAADAKNDRGELSGKSRNKAAQIIAGLVLAYEGKSAHGGRIDGISEVLSNLDDVGVTVDEGVLRKWLRDGAELIPPPKKT